MAVFGIGHQHAGVEILQRRAQAAGIQARDVEQSVEQLLGGALAQVVEGAGTDRDRHGEHDRPRGGAHHQPRRARGR